jgi:hypothetical protein
MRRLLPFILSAAACAGPELPPPGGTPRADSAFAAVQARGAEVMGVDQQAATHVFEDLADGGRILFTANDASDTSAVRTIQAHLRAQATAFAAGDFSGPARVHGRAVPGTDVMAARRRSMRYDASDRPDGGELRIVATDPEALAAVRRFLQFQREDHRAAGHEGHGAAMDHAAHMRAGPMPGARMP